MQETIISNKEIRRKTMRAFIVFIFSILVAITGWILLQKSPKEAGALTPLRKVISTNESVFSSLFSSGRLSKTYSKERAAPRVRVNGDAGLKDAVDPATWRLQLIRKPGDTLYLTLDDIKSLPKTEIIFDFKCIEGWSQVSHWGGVRFSDFIKKYGLEDQSGFNYTGLQTPNGAYYVGIDMQSMMHPQTLLCYEMNNAPLTVNHGAPLRLIIPVKYGVKHLKRIGTIFFSNTKPRDYWYERGYDYFCGL